MIAAPSARADERAFATAFARWNALYEPLRTARGRDLATVIDRIGADSKSRERDVLLASKEAPAYPQRREAALVRHHELLEAAYPKATPRQKRALVRLAAILGDRFVEEDRPRSGCSIPTLEPQSPEPGDLVRPWIESTPATYLGLLDDPDPRVAAAAWPALESAFPDEVHARLGKWGRSPFARLRHIAAQRLAPPTTPETLRETLRFAEDPSVAVRAVAAQSIEAQIAYAEMPLALQEELERLYVARRKTFTRSGTPQRWLVLRLGFILHHRDLAPLALQALATGEPSLRWGAMVAIATNQDPVVVPTAHLLPLLEDPWEFTRRFAFEQAKRQGVPDGMLPKDID
jgi:hypothetical protein